MIEGLLVTALDLYKLLLIAYVVLSWLHINANRWTELLRRVIEPVLRPVRALLTARLPRQWQILDWSPLAVYLLVGLAQTLVRILL